MPEGSTPRSVILVTGGNSGIGYECVRALAKRDQRVAIASRSRVSSEAAIARIRAEGAPGPVDALDLDLGSLASVRRLAAALQARDLPVRALVCNAGLQMTQLKLTPEGCETTFAVNHLGHFLLANLLLRRLLANAPARILVVASGVHDPARTTGMPKPMIGSFEALAATGGPDARPFEGRLAYVNSKLCNLWFTYELVRRLEAAGLGRSQDAPLSVNAFEPGLVPGSGLARDYPPALRWIWTHAGPPLARAASGMLASINTAEQSGTALARLVLDPALERTSGKYFPSHTRFAEGCSSERSYAIGPARELWEESVRLSELRPEESPLVG